MREDLILYFLHHLHQNHLNLLFGQPLNHHRRHQRMLLVNL
jgi:hypothetical protein